MKPFVLLLLLLTPNSRKFVQQVNIKTKTSNRPQHFPHMSRINLRSFHVFTLQFLDQEVKYTHLILTLEDNSETKKAPIYLFQWTKQEGCSPRIETAAVRTTMLRNKDEQEYLLEKEKYLLKFRCEEQTYLLLLWMSSMWRKDEQVGTDSSRLQGLKILCFLQNTVGFSIKKRTLKFSSETVTPKGQYLSFKAEVVSKNCCVGNYESVNLSAFLTNCPEEQKVSA